MDQISRREALRQSGVAAAALVTSVFTEPAVAAPAPTAPVALERCSSYDLPALTERLIHVLNGAGGLKRLVGGKTVVVKVNLTGSPGGNTLGMSPGRTYHVHPNMALALAALLNQAGARRLRFVEGTYSTQPMEKTLAQCGWDLNALQAHRMAVDFEDTRNLGRYGSYTEVRVPSGGDLFPAYLLNKSYSECDVYISLAKLKNHQTAGVTLSMKNNFGITPTALYGQGAHDENSTNARIQIFHQGMSEPAKGIPREVDPHGPRVTSYRVPRHTVDACRIRPIDLAIIEGVETVSGGEGPWYPLTGVKAGLLVAGRNAVCTDAIATVCMGYDPQGASKTGPFPGDNHLALAAARGLGTNDPAKIEVVGLPVAEARHPFLWEPKARGV